MGHFTNAYRKNLTLPLFPVDHPISGRKNPLALILASLFFLHCFLSGFPFKFMNFIVQKPVVFIDIPPDRIQHKFLIYFFCRTVIKTPEVFVFFYVPKMAFCLYRADLTVQYTQKEIAEKIIEKEADYILQVKGNQENLMKDIALYFEKDIFPCKKKELEKEDRYYKEMCFEHGRQEIREYYVENSIDWLKGRYPEWKGLNGIGACILTVTEKGETTTAISYSIYSHPGMGAEEYGKSKRVHWGD